METIRKDLKQFVIDFPTEASQRWIELHTIPGAQPSNSSDHNWVIEQTITRNRTDEEIKMLTDQLELQLELQQRTWSAAGVSNGNNNSNNVMVGMTAAAATAAAMAKSSPQAPQA